MNIDFNHPFYVVLSQFRPDKVIYLHRHKCTGVFDVINDRKVADLNKAKYDLYLSVVNLQ